jgi:hypothetical protein
MFFFRFFKKFEYIQISNKKNRKKIVVDGFLILLIKIPFERTQTLIVSKQD